MKVYATINGTKRELRYSMAVMFAVAEEEANGNDLIGNIGCTKLGYEAVKTLLIMMANDAELLRRSQGYDNMPFVTEKDFNDQSIKPYQLIEWIEAVNKAISAGVSREIDEQEEETEVDLGLAELRKKNENE